MPAFQSWVLLFLLSLHSTASTSFPPSKPPPSPPSSPSSPPSSLSTSPQTEKQLAQIQGVPLCTCYCCNSGVDCKKRDEPFEAALTWMASQPTAQDRCQPYDCQTECAIKYPDNCPYWGESGEATYIIEGPSTVGGLLPCREEHKHANVCVAADSAACRLLTNGHAKPLAKAYAQCFGPTRGGADAEAVHVSELTAGDMVLAVDEARNALFAERVLVNQHARANVSSALLELFHTQGSIALTPDHVLFLDGDFRPASKAVVNSTLATLAGPVRVVRIESYRGAVVNPVTTSGRILLTSSSGGVPVVSSTHPAWIASLLLAMPAPLPYPFFSLASAVAPQLLQAYWDNALEHFFAMSTSYIKTGKDVPLAIVLPLVFVVDIILTAGFVLYSCSVVGTVSLFVVAAMKLMRLAKTTN